ncbi:hypothetical protein SUGI_0366060 [Cryptomeria japonica]|uniref:putative disease resistance protein At3g14460 n=1 Tax=Cryptomeria japonica TaxID=3369 RepID=UPI0024089612|nr:putative disease resistance protein At3g14460 [Cryptomeria japonica]GLJ20163.1 hypothetical protein SUGI_0366060 [Cryptomeria japonica]
MASALVDVVVEKIGGMIIEQINKEVSLICNFRNDFQWLSKKLTNVRGYLTDADAQSANNESVKSWLLEVADVAWDAEDILDECAVQSRGTNNESPQSSCVCAFSYSQLVFRYKMARRIKDVKDRIRSIMVDVAELKLVKDVTHPEQPSTSTSQTVNFRGSSVIERGSRPVAIESKVEEVLSLLNNRAAPVIAVVGMGGVGKTFLMQNVFNRIKDKFEKSVWLSISQAYSLRKLQADMAWQIKLQAGEDLEIKSQADMVINGRISEVHAAQWILSCLTNRSSLIVLDDVWRATGEDDLISALGLPTVEDSRCKIVVTTRSRHVSSNMNARVYEVHPLSQQESWELFCAFAFPDSQKNQPPQQLEGIARQVEGECGRLPLAVKTVAASLAGKRLSRDWETKLGQLRAASSTEDSIMQILKLSYDSLPVYLKPCFAYLSFFPEDEEINSRYLINLWIAEGYIPQEEDQHQLDIGWNYLCHLHSLCLVERVGDMDVMYDQGWGMFKLHDLLLDLAISIGKESQCAFSVDESFRKGPAVQTSSSYRRILMCKKSIVDGDVDVMASNRAYSASRLRTLSFSQNRGIQKIPAILLSGARVLRVLDLSGTQISSLPACVGNLKLLRLLNLRGTNIAEVPECVKSNTSLRFLDISICENLEQLPEWIGELNFLEHLDLWGTALKKFNGSMPKGLSKLVSLQVLITDNDNKLSVQDDEFLSLEHLVNLVNLREVRIGIRHEAEFKSIEDGILSILVKMRTLKLINTTGVNLPPLSEKMLAMKDLEFLRLWGFAVPNWICGFSNLMQLELYDCHCVEYPALEMMPNLIKLEIWENDICKALPKGFGKSKGFPQLLFLEIRGFSVLEEFLELEDGAMPNLEILNVFLCPNLKKVPSGLEPLRSLKECHFRKTGVDDMLKEGEELWNKMKVNNSNVINKTG